MPAQAIHYFMLSPYSVVMDVKMLDFFRHMGTATLISMIVLLIASLFIRHVWCRYLCPYGALMGVVSLLSPFKIRRNAESCIDCGKCAKSCPSRIPVDKLIQVRTVECTGCMTCVEPCDAPRDKCALSCAINGIHAAFHYLKKNYISGCVMTVPTG